MSVFNYGWFRKSHYQHPGLRLLGGLTMTALKLLKGSLNGEQKDYINRIAQSEPRIGVLFTEFVEKTASRKAKRMGPNYMKSYKSVIRLINDFSEENNAKIFTNSVNEEFLEDFILFMEERGNKQSYIKYNLVQIKGMVKKAGTYNYAIDPSFDDVDIDDEDHPAVYLSMNEITRIYYYQGLTRIQSKWRDLFVLGCLTGLRYSDYSKLTKDNFVGDYIVKKTQKTGIKVTIPTHDYVKEIFAKYDEMVPRGLTIQQFNRHLKNICRKVGLNELVTFHYTRGGQLVTEVKPKWDLVTSHSARRSFATNAYLAKMEIYQIMAITGHTTEKSFFRYIKIKKEDLVRQAASDIFWRR